MAPNPRDVYVLDCSQVRDRAAFWEHYVRDLPVRWPEQFGRNLDALWDALSAAGPGWPGPVWVELHNTEQLANHEGAFLEALETMAADLARDACEARLSIVRHGAAPRGRLYQHDRLRTRQLLGAQIERACYWQPRPLVCGLLWIKPAGMHWQRFHLDAGFAVWSEECDALITDELEELAGDVVELREVFDDIMQVVVFDPSRGAVPEVRLELGSGRLLRLYPAEPSDLASDALLEIQDVDQGA